MVHILAILEKVLTPLVSITAALNNLLETYKRIVMLAFGTLAAILCLLVGVLLFLRYNAQRTDTQNLSEPVRTSLQVINDGSSIPVEDIFLPDKPDYLPEVILEQEPHVWSAEDTRIYWTNPLENDHINWQDTITNMVNDIMDAVP
jgi:hypothetical protein